MNREENLNNLQYEFQEELNKKQKVIDDLQRDLKEISDKLTEVYYEKN